MDLRSRHGFLSVLLTGAAMVWAPSACAQQGGGGPRILQQAPTDRSVAIPKASIDQYLRDMDRDGLATLRMIEGGKFNVNIRRIRDAETALVHPNTIDLWVVIDGSGTLTTGGQLQDGRILNGVTYPLEVGDVAFIPSGTPHGVSGVNSNITWLNIRWDTDWPESAELMAGNYQGSGGRFMPVAYAGAGAVHIPRERLESYMADMGARDSGLTRMVEGGHFNINIRRQETPSGELHPATIDTWVVLEGGGTVNTGFDENAQGERVPNTGDHHPATVGDVFFIPPGVRHGFSQVSGVATWLNIRWDTNW